MAAQNVTPTRSELINVKRRIQLSKSGYNLLKKKRDGLMYEIFAILPKVKSIRTELVKRYKEAYEAIQVAAAAEGALAVRSVAYTVPTSPAVHLREHNIMGVKVPKIQADNVRRSLDQRGYGLIGTSPVMDAAASSTCSTSASSTPWSSRSCPSSTRSAASSPSASRRWSARASSR